MAKLDGDNQYNFHDRTLVLHFIYSAQPSLILYPSSNANSILAYLGFLDIPSKTNRSSLAVVLRQDS